MYTFHVVYDIFLVKGPPGCSGNIPVGEARQIVTTARPIVTEDDIKDLAKSIGKDLYAKYKAWVTVEIKNIGLLNVTGLVLSSVTGGLDMES